MKIDTVVVTRHPGLVDYLVDLGIVTPDVAVVSHATPEIVRGKHVVGVLPHWLAAEATMITEIPLDLPAEMRGKELTVADMRRYAGKPSTYVVVRHDTRADAEAFILGCREQGFAGVW